jgi:HEAT repeat protein
MGLGFTERSALMEANPELYPLLHDLGSRYAIPRRKAIDALVEIGAAAVPALVAKLEDKNLDAQKAAAEALERIATPEALEAAAAWHARRDASA